MNNSNTFGIAFYLKKQNAKNEQAPIYARITYQRRSVVISTKKSIPISHWNELKGVIKGRSDEARMVQKYLERFKSKIIQIFEELLLRNEILSAEKIKSHFLGNEKSDYFLLETIDFHNENMQHSLAWGTLKNYFTTRQYMEKYIKKVYKRSDIYLTELDYKFITGFERFMKQSVPLKPHQACNQNTIMKHIERTRKVINMAIKYEWLDKDPFIAFKPSFVKKERESLTRQELQVIEAKTFSIPRLEFVKNLFVFSCYTGLAYIDTCNLTNKNIHVGNDGELWISTYREKSNIPIHIPLLPKAIEIIEKYKNDPAAQAAGKVFPPLSNQKLNTYLKEIADVCGITKPLTFHIARHTFATTITLLNGVPIETVSKLLGHTSIRTTQIYAKVLNEKISHDMRQLKSRLM